MAAILEKEKRAEAMLQEAKVSCDVMRQQTKKQQEDLLEETQQQIEMLKENARKTGYDEGFSAGREEGIAQVREQQQQTLLEANTRAEHTLAVAQEEMQTYVQQAEQQIMDIALHVVDKVLPQHFLDVPQVILPLVQKALLKIKDQSEVKIHVAPEAYEMVLMAKSEFQSVFEDHVSLTVVSDESLKVGDCVVETPNGNVDARLTTQLELIKKAVQDVML